MNRRRSAPRVVFGDVHYPPGSMLGPLVQQDFQIVIIYEGEARITIDGRELYVPGHHATLLLPTRRELFHFASAEATRHTWCAIAPELVPPDLQAKIGTLSTCLPHVKHDLVWPAW